MSLPMDRQINTTNFLLLFLVLLLSSFNVFQAKITETSTEILPSFSEVLQANPFTPRASLIRYWSKRISNNLPKPLFLLSKASPLNAINFAILTKLANQNSLSAHLDSFCSLANLYCSFDSSSTVLDNKHDKDANFAVYSNKGFANYGSSRRGGVDSFKNYSDGLNNPGDSFKKYSGASTAHSEAFTNYANNANVADSNFTSYGSGATGGSGEFKNYDKLVNVPNLRFTNYDSDANNHKLSFSSYSDDTNSGSEAFTAYGKNANSGPSEFNSYGDNSNIIASGFTGYGELGNGANDSFRAYGQSGNNPHNNFKSYGMGGNSGIDSFSRYRNGANVGDDSFQSYARNSNSGKVRFASYGRSFNHGNDTFKEYGKGSTGRTNVEFKSYSMDRTFKDYTVKGVAFSEYNNFSTVSEGSLREGGSHVNRWVEPGKFFRESDLKQGNVMMMPDIRDRMPRRSFLPPGILSKLPFSTSRLSELKEIFHARENSTMESVLSNALAECEKAPSRGETKRCVGSAEDMVDFAVSVLGHDVTVRTTKNVSGSKQKVMIGKVKGINGGEVTKSVSCHQSLYPYLLYYCHSVPKVRVYEADILDVESKTKTNEGIAICHIDTSAWGSEHGAFVALGSIPGKIEVCHWIFENDMTWTIAD
ncbi:polygalacturonase 1 beta-like protein 3 [Juglans microcarpa x Juglans regia]|uniref:polygalacturonase 1 beta-like protein 3 n=1 Tax=Juglans microcarpa x Juglans regia TaxID=2249226 RepID=UPI001B7F434F|nr:polygalacturonase 1 beta-like protein 3 [Juglans microcarpa x Juglans regia]